MTSTESSKSNTDTEDNCCILLYYSWFNCTTRSKRDEIPLAVKFHIQNFICKLNYEHILVYYILAGNSYYF